MNKEQLRTLVCEENPPPVHDEVECLFGQGDGAASKSM
jgi:hypothetical protein